jgi:hypothetical protein
VSRACHRQAPTLGKYRWLRSACSSSRQGLLFLDGLPSLRIHESCLEALRDGSPKGLPSLLSPDLGWRFVL